MIFHENCLLADNSHEMSFLIFSNLGKMENLSSAAVVIDALRVNSQSNSMTFKVYVSYLGLAEKIRKAQTSLYILTV